MNIDSKKIYVTRASMPPYEEYIKAIKPLWDTHVLTNMGTYHKELEKQLKKYLNVPELSLMVNGHMALEMVLQAMDFPEGSEVITTPFTFISTTHAIVRNRLTPIFCDIKMSDGTIDETKIEELITEKTVAIVPVHVYGNICSVEEIQRIAEKYNLKVIYDAAHAFGERYKGTEVGNFGDASIFSFHATKIFNTIEGGAVTFSEHQLYEKLYNLKNFGVRAEEIVVAVGANGKMNEFAAVMGLCNLKYVSHAIEERKKRFNYYKKSLENVKGIRLFLNEKDTKSNYSYFPILVEDDYGINRDELYLLLRERGFYARKYFYPLTCDQLCFGQEYKEIKLINARTLAKEILVLPFYAELDFDIITGIANIIACGNL